MPLVRSKSLKRVFLWVDPLEPRNPVSHSFEVSIETTEKHEWHHKDRRYHCSDCEVRKQAADEVSQRNSAHNEAPQAEKEHEEARCSPIETNSEVNYATEDQRSYSNNRHFSKCLCVEVWKDVVHRAALLSQKNGTLHLEKANCAHECEHQLICGNEE